MVRSCGQMPPTVTSLKVIASVGSQSVAVAVPVLAGNVLAVHCIVTLIGQVITGGVLSSTTIVCMQLLELPQSSVATQVREMVLSCGHAPPEVTSLKVTVGVPSQLSVAVAVPFAAGNVLDPHWIVVLAGHVIDGAVLSSTKIVCTQEPVFPQSSVATQVRVIVLSCGQAPATVASLNVIVGVASQLSEDVAFPVFAGSVLAVHWIVIFGGQVIDGPTVSSLTMV